MSGRLEQPAAAPGPALVTRARAPAPAPSVRSPTGKARARPTLSAEINVTPLVDVVLVLLIIFMVVTPSLEAGVSVNLPRAAHAQGQQSALEPLTVSIAADGKLWLEREPMDAVALGRALAAAHAAAAERRVVLKADRAVGYEKVRALFKQCRDLGFPGVSLQVLDRAHAQAG